MLVVLKVLDNVPHIAGFDCWGKEKGAILVRAGRRRWMVALLPSLWDVTKATTRASPGDIQSTHGQPSSHPTAHPVPTAAVLGEQTKTEHVR